MFCTSLATWKITGVSQLGTALIFVSCLKNFYSFQSCSNFIPILMGKLVMSKFGKDIPAVLGEQKLVTLSFIISVFLFIIVIINIVFSFKRRHVSGKLAGCFMINFQSIRLNNVYRNSAVLSNYYVIIRR